MKRFGSLMAASALCGALVASGPASAFGGHFGGFGGGAHFGGFGGGAHFGGFGVGRVGGWGGGGWRGAGWGGGWNRGWNTGWNRWSGGWNGWGWGWGGGLVGLGLGYGLASGWDYPYYDYWDYPYGGYTPYYAPGYAYATPVPGPLVTGRSVATGGIGDFCATPVRTCQLVQPSYVGGGCSCRVPGGRARGSVTP